MTQGRELELQLEQQRRRVDVEHFDITIRELVRMAEEGELSMAPTYQRKFRWSEESESKLVESIFLGLPVPSLFFASNRDGTWEIVDGLQRISTLIHYTSNKPETLNIIQKSTPLVLAGLEKADLLMGLSFPELPTPLQLSFMKRSLRVTVLSDKSDYEARFDMFERLNTGGVVLTPQEVRACIFRGKFVDFLTEMADYPKFKTLVKLQKGKQVDGTREEIVLKFFAYLYWRDRFTGKVSEFLTAYARKAFEQFDVEKEKKLFMSAVDFLTDCLGGRAFLRRKVATTPLNQFEAVLVGVGELKRKRRRVARPKGDWLNDADLVKYSTGATNTSKMLNERIERAMKLFSN